MSFNHLVPDVHLESVTSVEPGEYLGTMATRADGSPLPVEQQHIHISFYEDDDTDVSNRRNPLEIWDNPVYQDPQGDRPLVADTNSDGHAVRFRKGPDTATYLPDDGKVYGPVDIVVEAWDHQSVEPSGSPDAKFNPPLKIGYHIQRWVDNRAIDVVQSFTTPYLLIDGTTWIGKPYWWHGRDIPLSKIQTLVDVTDTLQCNIPSRPTWREWLTYIVANTKSPLPGLLSDLDAGQCWATDARNTETSPNGWRGLPSPDDPEDFVPTYEKARFNKEAKFPDGKYLINIHLEDYKHKQLPSIEPVIVDNFLPFVEEVEVTILGGEIIYRAGWMFSAEDEQLDWVYYTEPKDPTPGEALQIQVTTSETMHDKVKVTLTGQTITLSSSDHQSMVWEGTIVPSAFDDYTLTIQGHDMADNQLLAFSGTQPSAFSAQRPKPVPKRTASADWPPDYEALRQDVNGDTMHQLGALPPPPIWSITTPIVSMCEENLDTGGVVCIIDDGSVEGNVDVKASVALHPKDNLSAISVLLDSADTPGRTHTGTYWMPQDGLELVVTPQADWFLCAPEISEERPCPEWPEDAPGYQAPPADSTETSTLGWHVTAQEDQQTDTCQVVITWDAEETPSITLDLQPASVCDGIQEDPGTLEATAICTWAVKDRTDYVWWEEGIVEESSTYEISLLKYEGCNLMFRVYYGCLDNSGWRKDPDSPHVFKTHDDLIQPDEPGFEPVQLMEVRYENCQWSDDEPVCIWRDCQDGPCHIPLYVSRAFSTAFVRQYRSSVICDKTDTSFHWRGNSLCQYEKTPGTMVIDPASPGQVEIPLGP